MRKLWCSRYRWFTAAVTCDHCLRLAGIGVNTWKVTGSLSKIHSVQGRCASLNIKEHTLGSHDLMLLPYTCPPCSFNSSNQPTYSSPEQGSRWSPLDLCELACSISLRFFHVSYFVTFIKLNKLKWQQLRKPENFVYWLTTGLSTTTLWVSPSDRFVP